MESELAKAPGGGRLEAPRDDELAARARELLASDPVRQAADLIRRWDERTLGWQAELTEIPAPPYGEEARAA
ncbi:MAG: hypothetical protein PVI57_07300, partial [Gemmatimonadota bacterium]